MFASFVFCRAGVVDAAIDVRCVLMHHCAYPSDQTQGEREGETKEQSADQAAVYSVSGVSSGGKFDVSVIEVNPLGPGCVWGVFDWDCDKEWLLGRTECTRPARTIVSGGNATDYLRVAACLYSRDSPRDTVTTWECVQCSFENSAGNPQCTDCGSKHAAAAAAAAAEGFTDREDAVGGDVVVAFTSAHCPGFSMGGLAHMPAPYLAVLHDVWGLDAVFDAEQERERRAKAKKKKTKEKQTEEERVNAAKKSQEGGCIIA